MKKRSIGSAILAILASLAIAGTALGAAFDNGSFENGTYVPTFAGWDFERLSLGSTTITGWTVSQGDIDWVGAGLWPAAEGTKSIDLDGAEETAGAISQTIDTSVNSTYFVTFKMSGNPGPGPVVKTMTVDVGGAPTAYTFDTSVITDYTQDMHWALRSYTFVATSTSTTLTFTSTTGSGWGPAIDNIVIVETLATGANCKGGGWQTMIDRYGTAFKNQGDCVSYYATGEKNLAY